KKSMTLNIEKKFDFKVVKKTPPPPKKPVTIKREVFPHDILTIRREPEQKEESPISENIRMIVPAALTSLPAKPRTSYKAALPVLAGVLIITVLLQSVVYLQSARE